MKTFFDQYLIQPFVLLFFYLYSYFNDPGWAIIFATILLKIIALPIDYFSYLEEEKIKKISKKINEQTKNIKDIIKKSEIISKIYKEENIHPFKNFLLQLINLPIFIAFFLAIPKFLNNLNNTLFLNIINLKYPNIFLGSLVVLAQFYFVFYFSNPEHRKLILFLIAAITPIFFILNSGLLIYILINMILVILERKIIFTQQINKRIISVKKNDS